MEQPALTIDEALLYMKARYNKAYSRSYLARLRCEGRGALNFKIGSTVLYDQIDLDNWIRGKTTPKAETVTQAQAIQRGLNIKITESEPIELGYDDGWIEMD
mgnify:CR=1 FL=1